MEDLTCAFTGHRPSSYRFGYDEEHPDCCKLKALMTLQIVSLIENGVTTFLSGMALGADIWGAEIVLACKKKYPQMERALTRITLWMVIVQLSSRYLGLHLPNTP